MMFILGCKLWWKLQHRMVRRLIANISEYSFGTLKIKVRYDHVQITHWAQFWLLVDSMR